MKKPISPYAQGRTANILLSSAGLKFSRLGFTNDISLGMDNIGIKTSKNNGNSVNSHSLRINL